MPKSEIKENETLYILMYDGEAYTVPMAVHFSEASKGPDSHVLSPLNIECFTHPSGDVRIKTFNSAAEAQKCIGSLAFAAKNNRFEYFHPDQNKEEMRQLKVAEIDIRMQLLCA